MIYTFIGKKYNVPVEFFDLKMYRKDLSISLKQQKKFLAFLSIREILRREKFYFGRFAKVSAPKVYTVVYKFCNKYISDRLYIMHF